MLIYRGVLRSGTSCDGKVRMMRGNAQKVEVSQHILAGGEKINYYKESSHDSSRQAYYVPVTHGNV